MDGGPGSVSALLHDQGIHRNNPAAGADQRIHIQLRNQVTLVVGEFREAHDHFSELVLVYGGRAAKTGERSLSLQFAASSITVSFSNSTRIPPRPATTSGPNSGSIFAPTMISVPAGAMGCTSTPLIFALAL